MEDKVENNVYFSDVFEVKHSIIEKYGALDISLVCDNPAFVELLDAKQKPEAKRSPVPFIVWLPWLLALYFFWENNFWLAVVFWVVVPLILSVVGFWLFIIPQGKNNPPRDIESIESEFGRNARLISKTMWFEWSAWARIHHYRSHMRLAS